MILLRPVCWIFGHKRGKEFNPTGNYTPEALAAFQLGAGCRLFRCPRCGGNERRYKVKPQSPAKQTMEGGAE